MTESMVAICYFADEGVEREKTISFCVAHGHSQFER